MRSWHLKRWGVVILLNFMYATPAIFGWHLIQGNLSASKWFGLLNLSDPLLVLQSFISQHRVSIIALTGGLTVVGFFFLFGGRSFCSWVCPLHLILELTSLIRRSFKGISLRQIKLCPSIKYWVLLVVLIVSYISGLTAFEVFSPIGITSRAIAYGPDMGLIFILIIIIFELSFASRAWCHALCPLGALFGLIGRYSPLRVRITKERCNQCLSCQTHCLSQQIMEPVIHGPQTTIDPGECTRCGYCIDDCSLGALKFEFCLPKRFKPLLMEERRV